MTTGTSYRVSTENPGVLCLMGHDNHSLGGETRGGWLGVGSHVAQADLESSVYLRMTSHLYILRAGSTDV